MKFSSCAGKQVMIPFLRSLLFDKPKTTDPKQAHKRNQPPIFFTTRKFEMSVESYTKLMMAPPMSPVEWAMAKLKAKLNGTSVDEQVQRIEDARGFLTRDYIFKLVDEGAWADVNQVMPLVIALGRFDKANANYFMQAVRDESPHGMWWVDKANLEEKRKEHAGRPTAVHPDQRPSINKRYIAILENVKDKLLKLELEGILKPSPPMVC